MKGSIQRSSTGSPALPGKRWKSCSYNYFSLTSLFPGFILGIMKETMTKSGPKTYADYQKLKEGEPYQLINGMFVKSPSPTVHHQELIKRFVKALLILEDKGIGRLLFAPMDVYFSDTEVYQPDIIFIAADNTSVEMDKIVEGAPDLIIEILSPSTAYYDLRHKADVYAQSGVREYWIVDPGEETVEVYSNAGGRFSREVTAKNSGEARSTIFPEFRVDIGKLFR
jgi:Uma2 family endonuclease